MSTVFIAFMALTLTGAFILVVLNRASPSVVNAAVPLAFGALSALGLVFAFTRPEPISRVFPVVFVVERASLLPIVIPDRPFGFLSLHLADEMRQLDPKTFEQPKGQDEGFDFIVPLFHEFLHKVIVDSLAAKQFGTWRMRTERFGGSGFEQFGPMPDAGSYSSKVLTTEELTQAFSTNRFARVHSMFGKWALPPGTELQIDVPHHDPQLGQTGVIRLKNRFCEMTIRTVVSMSVVGLGSYTALVGIPQEEAQKMYWTLQYIVRINASFPWYLIGHPDMAVHREWADGITEELTHAFDEESMWRRSIENYMLRQHLPPAARAMTIGLGPIQSQPRKPVAPSATDSK